MKLPLRRKRLSDTASALNLPEMQAARDRRTRRIRGVLTLAIMALIGMGIVWVIVRSPLFRIRAFAIEGEEQLSEGEILSLLRSRIFYDSKMRHALGFRNMLIWPAALSERDMSMLPLLKSAVIEKNYLRHSITVRVSERVPRAVWCFEKTDPLRCAWFDDEGVILERALSVEGNLIRRVSDWSQDPLPMKSLILPGQFVSNFFTILRVLDETKLALHEIRIEDLGLQEAKVRVRGGPELMFSLRFPSQSALPVLKSLQKGEHLRGKSFRDLEYVDFRVENRAYFK
jgi:hypothetical protein